MELIFIPDGKASTIALKYQAPEAPKKEGAKTGGNKDKDAAAKAKKQAAPAAPVSVKKGGLPEMAPTEAQETVILSEGKKGFEIPLKVSFFTLLWLAIR